MFDNRRYIYAVFMCHLAIEKALKGLYQERLGEVPPKVHNLVFLVEKIGLDMPEALYEGLFSLNRVSVPTRYPDDLKKMQKEYNKHAASTIFGQTKAILRWLKTKS
jgi:HEPN domain-containing protein